MKSNKTIQSFVLLCLGAWLGTTAIAQSSGPGKAVSFDGINGYATVGATNWFSGNFTIEGWVYVRSYNNWSRLIDFGNGADNNEVYLAISGGTGGFPWLNVLNSGGSSIAATQQIPTNQWVHLAATLSNTTGTIYINGVNVGSGPINIPNNVTRTLNYIGRSHWIPPDAYANAVYDEIRIWNVAKTQSQIQANMRRSLAGNEPGLVGYWRFDEGSGTTIVDATGQGKFATLVGGATWINSAAQIASGAGGALSFNTSQSGSVTHQPALNAYPLTVMTWFKTTTGGGALVNKYGSGSNNGYNLLIGGGGDLVGWYFRDGANNVFNGGPMGGGLVADGKWHHTAMVIDAAGGRLYLDGIQKASLPWTGSPGAPTTTQNLWLNHYPGDSLGTIQMDETSVWNVSLTTTQIQQFMTNPPAGVEPGLLSYWRMDEGSGTNVVDATGHAYNMTLSGNPAWMASPVPYSIPDAGYALNLTGNRTEYLRVTNGVWFNGDFTVEGWVFARSYNNWSRLFDFANGPDNHNIYLALSQGTGGFPAMGVFTNTGIPVLGSTQPLPLNQWVHLACTLSNTIGRIFINGSNVASGILNRPANVIRTNNYIGRSNYGQDAYANAWFDEIRIWNVARTQQELQTNAFRPLTGGEAGLIGYFRLDEGFGTNVVNAAGNSSNAVLAIGGSGTLPSWAISSAPLNPPPLAVTLTASSITATSAVFRGNFTPNSLSPAAAYFVWGTSTSYGNTNAIIPGAGFATVTVSNLVNLQPATTYHYQLIATNRGTAIVTGGNQSFSTSGALPIVTTSTAVGLLTNGAILRGSVNPRFLPTTVWFEWGLTTSYGNTNGFQLLAPGNSSISVSNILSSLSPATSYQYRVVATNVLGMAAGANQQFQTLGDKPAIGSQFANNLATNAAVLNANVSPNYFTTTAWFEWGTNTSYSNTSALFVVGGTNNTTAVLLTNLLSGLTPYTTYHFRLVATNALGTTIGGNIAFASLGGPPQILSQTSANLTTNSATINASVSPNFFPTVAWFEWGTNTSYGNTNFIGDIGSGSTGVPISANLANLPHSTTYHFRAAGSNLYGTTYGNNQTFLTRGAPQVTTLNGISGGPGGILNLPGSVNPNGFAATAYIEYGITTNLGSATFESVIGSGTSFVNYSRPVSNLLYATTYYYRAVGYNSFGTNYGATLTFVSQPGPPEVTLLAPTYSQGLITFRAKVKANNASTQVYFDWGPNLGNRIQAPIIVSGTTETTVSNSVGGLFPIEAQNFQYRVQAVNAFGTTFSGPDYFTLPFVTFPGGNPLFFSCTNGSSFPEPIISDMATNVAIAAGEASSLALRIAGNVAAWGSLNTVPPQATNVVSIAAGNNFNLALRRDGRVIAWGNNTFATNVPPNLTNAVALSVRSNMCMALTRQGQVVVWGTNSGSVMLNYSQSYAIAAGAEHGFVLTAFGLGGFGNNSQGQLNLPNTSYFQVAAGNYHSLGMSGGSILAAGNNTYGQLNVPFAAQSGQARAIAAGGYHSLALRFDGTVVAWGRNTEGQTNVPAGLNGVVAIAGGAYHSLAMRSNGTVVAWGRNVEGQSSPPTNVIPFSGFVVTNSSLGFATNNYFYNVTNALGLGITAVRSLVVTSAFTMTLIGSNFISLPQNSAFNDPGVTAHDSCHGPITNIIATGTPNVTIPGYYTVTYSATNSLGNIKTAQRTVLVTPLSVSALALEGTSPLKLSFFGNVGLTYTLEASTNLADWYPIANYFANPNTNFTYTPTRNDTAFNAYPLTVMAWIKTSQSIGGGGVVNKYGSSSFNGYQVFLIDGTVYAWYFGSDGNVYDNGLLDGGPVSDGQWHHIAFVVDSNGGRIHVDGVLKQSQTWSGTPSAPTTGTPLLFGLYPGTWDGLQYYSGLLDEVSIWNAGLSTNQIQNFMYQSLTGTETNLLGYWRMNEGQGLLTSDSGPRGNNARFENGITWIPGAPPTTNAIAGFSLQLNGTNQFGSVNYPAIGDRMFFRARFP